TNGRFLESLVTIKRAAWRRPPASATIFILEEKHSATVWIDYEQTSGSPRHRLHSMSPTRNPAQDLKLRGDSGKLEAGSLPERVRCALRRDLFVHPLLEFLGGLDGDESPHPVVA